MPVIRKAARSVAFQWPGVVEADDVQQEICLKILESPGTAKKLLVMEDDKLYRFVLGMGHQIASDARTDYDHFSGQFYYSVDDVKTLLSQMLTPTGFSDARIDLGLGVEKLADEYPRYYESIISRYMIGEVPKVNSEKIQLSRALTKLTDEMNRIHRTRVDEYDDGPGSRPKMVDSEW